MPGELGKSKDGKEMKVLPDGTRIVKRPAQNTNEDPTLEIQPPKGSSKETGKLRIKVRYPIR